MKSPMMQAAALWGCRSVSFALSAGAVIGFMAGSLEVVSWSYVQWFYGVVGLGLAAVLTAFVSGAYASGHWLAVVLAAAISIGLELSQTLERADALQRSRASESVLSRAAIAQLEGETVALTPAAKALAAAKARLANLRVSEANRTLRQQLKQDVDRLGIEVGMEDQARAQHRASLQQQVKDTQQDSSHSHAGIRLLMTLFGLSLAEASGAFGLALIAAFQAAFWWVASHPETATATVSKRGGRVSGEVFLKLKTWLRSVIGKRETVSETLPETLAENTEERVFPTAVETGVSVSDGSKNEHSLLSSNAKNEDVSACVEIEEQQPCVSEERQKSVETPSEVFPKTPENTPAQVFPETQVVLLAETQKHQKQVAETPQKRHAENAANDEKYLKVVGQIRDGSVFPGCRSIMTAAGVGYQTAKRYLAAMVEDGVLLQEGMSYVVKQEAQA